MHVWPVLIKSSAIVKQRFLLHYVHLHYLSAKMILLWKNSACDTKNAQIWNFVVPEIVMRLGSARSPDPLGELTALPRSLAVLQGKREEGGRGKNGGGGKVGLKNWLQWRHCMVIWRRKTIYSSNRFVWGVASVAFVDSQATMLSIPSHSLSLNGYVQNDRLFAEQGLVYL